MNQKNIQKEKEILNINLKMKNILNQINHFKSIQKI